ncbi:MAG TPA: hypothetical protein VF296_02315 [Gallionella sp.]
MSEKMEILFSLAGRVHVLMRREVNRIVDIEWICADAAYAKEVIKLARTVQSDELHKLADRIEEVHPELPRIEQIEISLPLATKSKYVTTLR